MRFTFRFREQTYQVSFEQAGEKYRATVNGQTYDLTLVKADGTSVGFTLDSHPQQAYTAVEGTRRWIFLDGETYVLDTDVPAMTTGANGHGSGHSASGESTIRAPMPGQVRALQVTEGAKVEKGQTLLLLEAMKMEIRIQAPRAGRLRRLDVRAGQTVERDQVLGEIE